MGYQRRVHGDASSVRMLARSAVRVASRSLKASSPAVAVAAREFQSSVKNCAIGAAEISSILEGRISSFYEDVNIDEIGRVLTVGDGIARAMASTRSRLVRWLSSSHPASRAWLLTWSPTVLVSVSVSQLMARVPSTPPSVVVWRLRPLVLSQGTPCTSLCRPVSRPSMPSCQLAVDSVSLSLVIVRLARPPSPLTPSLTRGQCTRHLTQRHFTASTSPLDKSVPPSPKL